VRSKGRGVGGVGCGVIGMLDFVEGCWGIKCIGLAGWVVRVWGGG